MSRRRTAKFSHKNNGIARYARPCYNTANPTPKEGSFMRTPGMPKTRNRIAVIAHRGGAGIMPENTLAAFQHAIRLGCDYVEIDVRTTRDGKLVIMHDRTVDRTTNGSGAVNELTLAAIRKLDAGAKFSPLYRGEKVPTLDEVFELCRGKINVYIDHKDATVQAILRTIRRHRMEKQVLVYGGLEKLKEWKQTAPDIPIMPSGSGAGDGTRTRDLLHGKQTLYQLSYSRSLADGFVVGERRLELLRLAAPDPKSGVSTNFTTRPLGRCIIIIRNVCEDVKRAKARSAPSPP
jgi:hypothetical protein